MLTPYLKSRFLKAKACNYLHVLVLFIISLNVNAANEMVNVNSLKPNTPSAPHVKWDFYYPQNGSITVYLPSLTGLTGFNVFSGTSSSDKAVSVFSSNSTVSIPTVGTGYNYIRLQACNGSVCSDESASTRVVIFTKPSPVYPSVANTVLTKGASTTLTWTEPSGTIWASAYYKISCVTPNGTELCGDTIPQVGSQTRFSKSISGFNEYGTYNIRVQSCNDASHCSDGGYINVVVQKPKPNVPAAPSVNWDFYYPQNSAVSVNVTSMENADNFNVILGTSSSNRVHSVNVGPNSNATIQTVGLGFNYIRLEACNGSVCSETSPATRILVFTKPNPVIPNVIKNDLAIGETTTLNWTEPAGTIWESAYYKLSCKSPTNVELCNKTIPQIGSQTSFTQSLTFNEYGTFKVRVQSCNDANHCSDGGYIDVRVPLPKPLTPAAPNVNWDFYYPQNSLVPVDLPQTDNVDYFYIYSGLTETDITSNIKVIKQLGKQIEKVATIGTGFNYLRLVACNKSGCSEPSPATKIVVFVKPQSVKPALSNTEVKATQNTDLKWTQPIGTIWESAEYKITCMGASMADLCNKTVPQIGEQTQFSLPLSFELPGTYQIQVQSCNDINHCSDGGFINLVVTPKANDIKINRIQLLSAPLQKNNGGSE